MAVEAHHHLLHAGGPKKLAAIHAGWEGGGGGCYDAPPPAGRQPCFYGATGQSHQLRQQQGYQQSAAAVASSGPMMMTAPGQYGCGGQQQVCADASESGVTFGGAQEVPCHRKRKRAAAGDQPHPFLGLGVAAHLQQQLVDVDRIVLQHTAKMWAELTEQRRRHARQVVAAAAKRLRAKDEEVERVTRLNWALEERVRTLFAEAQAWRDIAQSNEAAANALRAELQNALDAQNQQQAPAADGGADEDDAASCCCGENDVVAGALGEEEVGSATARRCVACGDGAAEVLLLPCRHLSACATCAAAARACPACGCAKNGTVCVNFS